MVMSARPPLRSKLVLVAPFLGKAALMGGDLSRRRSARVLAVQKCFDVLAPARERHHLFAAVSFQLPTSVGRGHADLIPKRLYFAGKFRAINRSRKALAPIDLDRIETPPHAIRPKRHVGDYDVGMEVWIGAVAISCTSLRWSCGNVVEAGGHDVGGGDPFLSAVAARLRELFKFQKRALDRTPMCIYQPRIVANQRLDADRLGRVEGCIPARAALVPAGGGADEDLARTGSRSPQHGTKIFLADRAAQSESFGTSPIPLAGNALRLSVIVVLGVFLLILSLSLADTERTFRHYQHGLNPLSWSAGRYGPQRDHLGPPRWRYRRR